MPNRKLLPGKGDTLSNKTNVLWSKYHIEAAPYPKTIISKSGSSIDIHSGSNWIPVIKVYNPGIGNRTLKWGDKIHDHPVIEHSAREYLIFCLKNRLLILGANLLANEIKSIPLNLKDKEFEASKKIHSWMEDLLISTREANEPLYSCLKEYITYCVENEFWGFNESMLWILDQEKRWSRPSNKYKSYKTSMLDPVQGPYTQQEVQAISNALYESDRVLLQDQALILLCRDFGLRPVQLALLREEDFVHDIRGHYIKIPHVKGNIRSTLRRDPKNFRQRPVSNELAQILIKLINENDLKVKELNSELEKYCIASGVIFTQPPRALFMRDVMTDAAWEIYLQGKISQYTYHRSNYSISQSIRDSSSRLRVPNSSGSDHEFLQIGAYRFRRTLATSMVLQGHTPEDVAYALGHQSTNTVKHYFRFSKDIIDYVNLTTTNSYEMNLMVSYWQGKFVDMNSHKSKVVKLTKIKSLGICLNHQPCEHHPTVTCYSCANFRPYRKGDHKKALENILKIKELTKSNSSGPVLSQLDLAIEMAKRCIIEQSKNDDT